jgi:hypothetical protein
MEQTAPAPSITVGGNVEGSIVVGDNNFVVNTNYGTVVYKQAAPQVRPRQMAPRPPRSPRGFVGRSHELSTLNQGISGREAMLIEGAEGMGKTTLIKYAANGDAARAQPNGVVFLEAIDQDGTALGRDDITQLLFEALFESDPNLKVSFTSARTYLSNTEPLVLLDRLNLPPSTYDNLLDLFPQAPILAAAEGTSGSPDFEQIKISPLSADESAQLLAQRAGFDLTQVDPNLVERLSALLAGVPLALVTVGDAIREYDLNLEQSLSLLDSIQTSSQRLIQAAIERSYRFTQSFLNPDEQKMVAYTAAVPGVSASRPWLEAYAGGQATSQKLENLGILKANSPRLRLHPAFTSYALEKANPQAVKAQLLSFLKNELENRGPDSEFIKDELANLLGLVRWASGGEYWQDVILLGRAVDSYLTLHGLWDAWGSVLQEVLQAARALGDLSVQAWALHQLGTREIGVGQAQAAAELLHQALDLRQRLGDSAGMAYTQHNLDLLIPPSPPGPPNGSPPRFPRKGFFFAASFLIVALFALGYAATAWSASSGNTGWVDFLSNLVKSQQIAASMETPLPDTGMLSAAFTATASATLTPTDTLTPTLEPTSTRTQTPTPSQTHTPTASFTPTESPTPTLSLSPTFSLPTGVVLKQSICHYGPGGAYLYADGLYPGDTVVINGRNYNTSWLYVQSDKSGRYCWISATLVQASGDISKLKVTPTNLPYTDSIGPPTNIQGTRQKNTVTISWDQIHVNMVDARGYLIEVTICQNGLRIPVIQQTDGTSLVFTDESGCSKPSGGKIYSVNARGYSSPAVIPWP